jgi:hypothetical protein
MHVCLFARSDTGLLLRNLNGVMQAVIMGWAMGGLYSLVIIWYVDSPLPPPGFRPTSPLPLSTISLPIWLLSSADAKRQDLPLKRAKTTSPMIHIKNIVVLASSGSTTMVNYQLKFAHACPGKHSSSRHTAAAFRLI